MQTKCYWDWDWDWFRVFENQTDCCMQTQIVLNILCQFSAHTSRIVMLNMHVNFNEHTILACWFRVSSDWDWFHVFENQTDCYMQTQNCT